MRSEYVTTLRYTKRAYTINRYRYKRCVQEGKQTLRRQEGVSSKGTQEKHYEVRNTKQTKG